MFINFFSRQKKEDKEVFLLLYLKEEEGEVWIVEKEEDSLLLRVKKNFFYSNAFENLVEDVDTVLQQVEQEQPALAAKVSKTIFLLTNVFVEKEKEEIKKIYLEKLKDLTKKLELKPLGYLEVGTTVVNRLEKKEGLPLSFILIEIGKTTFRFLVRKAGRTVFEEDFPKTDDFLFDFYDALEKVKDFSPLPVRLLLLDGKETKKIKELLSSHHFKEEFFIHPPRIEVIQQKMIEEMVIDFLNQQLLGEERKEQVAVRTETKEKEEEKKEVMGFIIGEDIAMKKEDFGKKDTIANFSERLFTVYVSMSDFFKKRVNFAVGGKKIFLGVFISLFIFTSLFIDEYFFHQASVTLYLPTKKIEKEIKIELSWEKIEVLKTLLKEEKRISTKGEKTVGEKAKGEVNLYNYTFSEKELKAGTPLLANGLQFVLETDVKIASASQIGEMRQPGKVKAAVSATFIGEEGNVKKGTVFQVGDLPSDDFFAKNENDFSGGVKRKVKVFSAEDKAQLERQLTEAIEKKSKSYFNQQKDEKVFLEDLTKIEIKNKIFSKEVGEEASTVLGRIEAELVYYFLPKKQLQEKLGEQLGKMVPAGFAIDKKKINYRLKEIKKEEEKVDLVFDCETVAVKKIDRERIKKDLVFVRVKDLKNIFTKKYQIDKILYKNEKKIPLFSDRLPLFIKNIKLNEESF